jgi:D-alanyl-D-alanine carboxypeptidase/D-alanyl-D-alanine-endopeptidase (penicillin-binding protein 4)
MRSIAAALLALAASLALAAPALAVDRSLGADVPKPAARGDAWIDAEVASLGSDVDAMLAGAKALRGAHVGLLAIDARDGRVLYQHNADDAFQPASTLKLLTGSAALDRLGPAFRFRTEASIDGTVIDGVLRGYLHLHGSGDILLDGAAFATLPAALQAVSIKTIEQNVAAIPERPEYPPGWSIDDVPWSYASPVTALGFSDDELTLTIAPGKRSGDAALVSIDGWGRTFRNTNAGTNSCAEIDLPICLVVSATTGSAGSESTLDAERAYGYSDAHVIGTIGVGAAPEKLSLAMPNPPQFAAAAAKRALVAAGIPVRERSFAVEMRHSDDRAPSRVVWTHDSEPLSDLLADTWIPSDNLLAESLLHALGAKPPALRGTRVDGIAAEKAWLTQLGIDPSTVAIEDGSGLSAYDRITPRDVVTVLRHDWDGPYHDVVLDALPIAGVRGTLRSAFTGTRAERRVFAKTGTVSHASALAGYVATARHGTVIFAFDVDDWVGAAADLRELHGRVLSRFVGN